MASQVGRHYLWQFQAGAITVEDIDARFGTEVAEGFQLWVAVQDDVDASVRNVGDIPAMSGSEEDRDSEASTIPAGDKPEMEGPDLLPVRDDQEAGMEHLAGDLPHAHGHDQLGATQLDGRDTAMEVSQEAGAVAPEEDAMADHGLDSTSADAPLEEVANACALGGVNDNNAASSSSTCGGEAPDGRAGREAPDGHAGLRECDPYVVPEAWRRVLTAWNEDIAVGITLDGVLPADAGLSCGTFEHQDLGQDHDMTGTTGHPVAATADDAAAGTTGLHRHTACYRKLILLPFVRSLHRHTAC